MTDKEVIGACRKAMKVIKEYHDRNVSKLCFVFDIKLKNKVEKLLEEGWYSGYEITIYYVKCYNDKKPLIVKYENEKGVEK